MTFTLGFRDLASSREVPLDTRSSGGIIRTSFGWIVALVVVYIVVGLHSRYLYDGARQTLSRSPRFVGQNFYEIAQSEILTRSIRCANFAAVVPFMDPLNMVSLDRFPSKSVISRKPFKPNSCCKNVRREDGLGAGVALG